MLSTDCALYQISVQVLQNRNQVIMGDLLHLVQDLLVALFGNYSLLGIALSALALKQLLKDVLKIQLSAPAKALDRKSVV